MRLFFLAASSALLGLAGCHSAYIAVTVQNRTGSSVQLLEVDYPSASFGTQDFAAGSDFHYRFKVLGSGPTTLTWTDAAHHDHKSSGPSLQEGAEGTITITLTPAGAVWGKSIHQT